MTTLLPRPHQLEIVVMNDRIDILMAENAALVDQKGTLTMEMEQLENELYWTVMACLSACLRLLPT